MEYSYVCISFLVNLFETNLIIMHECTDKLYALLLIQTNHLCHATIYHHSLITDDR